ncbi:MAG: 16S rRNA (adenine(1518)-N(6)/adenine(1519)-N(6))-dimethyltransferase RsmA [Prevotellaceae bacterium]|jgi:16S rRNA (adenine1518-N6/adenine1519-N6)-dimethyltransferase|nr:16S rRNA (adenine(1518)-N(6)/adenine(1519)-N(6))-dimethyltransferase RsmA [Prevotellaceae bacterium]
MIYVHPKKSLGQHFLHDRQIAERITQSIADNTESLLEIGAGTGILTEFLLKKDIDFKTVEIDGESIAFLRKTFPDIKDRLITGDFLKQNLHDIFNRPFSIIGNLPYNISSQIFFKIIDEKNYINEAVCMVQKEVAERIAEKPGSKTYGILSVFVQAFYDVEYLFTVHENAFTPPPKVKSAVIRLTRNSVNHLNCNESLFRKTVKATFNQRRKTIRNSLKLITGDKKIPENRFLSLRPETLSVSDFAELTNIVESLLTPNIA